MPLYHDVPVCGIVRSIKSEKKSQTCKSPSAAESANTAEGLLHEFFHIQFQERLQTPALCSYYVHNIRTGQRKVYTGFPAKNILVINFPRIFSALFSMNFCQDRHPLMTFQKFSFHTSENHVYMKPIFYVNGNCVLQSHNHRPGFPVIYLKHQLDASLAPSK